MRRRTAVPAVAVGVTLGMVLAACGGGSDEGGDNQSGKAEAKQNAAVGQIFKPSTKKGGTIRYANADDFDSVDPGDTYYGYAWDFARYYCRSLTMFDTKPGDEGNKIVPDLAESLGTPSDGGKTWTYKLRSGVKFEDGTPITSKDVKYAVERSLDKSVLKNGPTYFNDLLDLQGYPGAFKDPSPDKLGLKAIETPDDQTIVFHLKEAFGGFDYIAMLPATCPVPRDKDTGSKYKEHVVSSGPYMFDTYEAGKSFSLKRNPNWDPATDPHRAALPDRIEMQLHVNANDIDNRLMSGDLDVDVQSIGVQAATQAQILNDPNLAKNTDNPTLARTWFAAINPDVAPLDNIDCRKAVLYAADHDGYLRAFGGSVGGELPTSLLPPSIPGWQDIDLYNFKEHKTGDPEAAKQSLQACGQPNGFSTNLAYRSDRPTEKAAAEALQASLAKVGIKATLKGYPSGDYFALYAGKPSYAKSNNLGIMLHGWGADWPDGYGFLSQLVDSRTIRESGGNYNLTVKDPEIDKLLDEARTKTSIEAQQPFWAQIDKKVMEDATILPGVWAKVLLYRPTRLTNVYVNEGLGGYYDFVQLGVQE